MKSSCSGFCAGYVPCRLFYLVTSDLNGPPGDKTNKAGIKVRNVNKGRYLAGIVPGLRIR